MLDVTKLLQSVMKRQIYSNTDKENSAARIVLAELKTKYIDIKEEINAKIQYKLLTKMLNDRDQAFKTYWDAERLDLADKENNELLIIKSLLKELEKELPKQMTEEETIEYIKNIISTLENPNLGIIMSKLKTVENIDKKLAVKIINSLLKK